MCYRFVLVKLADITGIPAFTQHSTYGFYPVGFQFVIALSNTQLIVHLQ